MSDSPPSTQWPLQILHLEDNAEDAELIRCTLYSQGIDCQITRVASRSEFEKALRDQHFDLILADYNLPSFDGIAALSILKVVSPHVPFLLVTGSLGEDLAVETLKQGTTDFVLKDRLTRLGAAVERALADAKKRKELASAELALKDSEEKYRNLVERIPAIIYIAECNSQLKWHYVSPRIDSILGFSSAEWLTDADLWVKQIHPEDREQALERQKHISQSGSSNTSEYRIYNKAGKMLWVRDEAVAMQSSDSVLIHGMMIDITDLKKAEEAKMLLEQQLRQSQKIEALGQLAGGVAHDFNNLLMAISGYCELLAIRSQDETTTNYVTEVLKAVDHGAALTRQLLAFGRKQRLQPKVLNLNQILTGMEGMLRRLIRQDIELQMIRSYDLHPVKVDPQQVEQVLLNLVVNARDAMPHGGRITIETGNFVMDESFAKHHTDASAGSYAMLSVRDTGFGMDTATLSRIFEPFFTTKPEGKGTGLGLATVYGIVKQSGGYISVNSERGSGTTFHIYLPIAEEESPAADESARESANNGGRGETILLVDDNDGIRVAVAAMLEFHGYKVLQAALGSAALLLATQHNIQLLISDVVMPQMNGVQLAKRLRLHAPGLKVLLMSGYSESISLPRNRSDQNTVFLSKPVPMPTLLEKVRQLLG